MTKTIFICSSDSEYCSYIENKVLEVSPKATVVKCKNQGCLFRKLRMVEGVYIICDKLFLGLVVSEKLYYIRGFLNSSAKVMVTDWQSADACFGLRIKNLGFDAFINNIGNDKELTLGISKFLETGHYFSVEMEASFLNKSLNEYAKFLGDVAYDEIDAVLKVRCNGNAKSSKKGTSDSTIYNRISNFKKKMGIVTDEELDRIIHQIKDGGIL